MYAIYIRANLFTVTWHVCSLSVFEPLWRPGQHLGAKSCICASKNSILDFDPYETKEEVFFQSSSSVFLRIFFSQTRHSLFFMKVLNIPPNDSLDSIPSLSPSVKIQIFGGKVCLWCKGKTLLGIVNKLLKTKSLLVKTKKCLSEYRQIFFCFNHMLFPESFHQTNCLLDQLSIAWTNRQKVGTYNGRLISRTESPLVQQEVTLSKGESSCWTNQLSVQ